jgi:hypothetical protein
MNIKTYYTFCMHEYDEDGVSDDTATVRREVTTESLQDLTTAFLYFLWNAGFAYVEDVVVHKRDGGEVSGA